MNESADDIESLLARYREVSAKIDLKTGPYGDEECFPCQECSNDHYVYIPTLEFLPPYCTKCSANCTSVNRYMKKSCSSQSNWECGDCLPGYENKYGNSDFPCTKKTHVKSSSETSTPVANPAITQALVGSSHQGNESGGWFASLPVALQVLIIVFAAIFVFVIAAISGALACNRYCPPKSLSRENSSLLHSEVEIDGGRDIPQTGVRGELSNPASLPENCARLAVALNRYNQTTSANVCHCLIFQEFDCLDCVPLLAKSNSQIGNNLDLIAFIASEVCHDPLKLFWAIGVQDSDIYILNDDRNRAPEKISQKDFIYNVLHRWLQVNTEATYRDLFKGLCQGGFHHINRAVCAQYDSYVPQV
ncbi:uncharacterized protein LOC127879874 isoform X2 [Dreissena polymorpha]|uniref:uncharacterized protein LOC127879874 isoform X2 n=1 Tax=Dreissena polymorpha TaxID=45954 RepID=UPI002264803F|nr:uncharacterized protein LOC127879874 isoform X2 [Dreissena polymorpha]